MHISGEAAYPVRSVMVVYEAASSQCLISIYPAHKHHEYFVHFLN